VGGSYPLKISYSAETTATGRVVTETRTDNTVLITYRSPFWYETSERFLDSQAWVAAFNSNKALGMFLKPQLIVRSIPLAFTGWLYALSLVLAAFPLAIVVGLGTAFLKMSKIPPVRWIAAVYINVIRGTPLFLQIALVFLGLRIGGVVIGDWPAAVIVLMINSGAYLAEIFRAGIQSISKGQFEAASSLGMNYAQSMMFVIIPQTVKRVLPTMTSEFILLFKDTALFAAFGVAELMFAAQNIVARTGNMTPFIVVAVYYLIITIPLINIVGRLESRLALSEHGQSVPEVKPRSGLLGRWMPGSAQAQRTADVAGKADR
jgi:polar amino acid transport system substrate-binding protein